jgi:MFS family permease
MQMMVVPALPAIERDLGADADDIAWIISAFLASTAVASPLAGRCGDLYGKRKVLVVVLAVFAAGGLLGMAASSVEALVVARALQGVGGAVFPLAYGLAKDIVPSPRVPVTIGLISGSFGIGGSAGLVLSGPLVDHVAWQATVGVGGALGAVAAACVLRFVPAVSPGPRVPLDVAGGVLLTVGLGLLLLGISGHAGSSSAAGRAGLLAGGAAVMVLWAVWEARHRSPLVDVRLLVRRSVWPVNAAGAAIGFGMYALGFLVPQLVQADPTTTGVGFGASVTVTSLYLLPALVVGLAVGAGAGVLGRRHGSALPFLLGLALMAAGYLGLALGLRSSLWVATATLVAHGVGLNLALAAMANLIVEGAPDARTAEAAGVNTTIRTIGGALGIQVVAIVLTGPAGAADEVSAGGFELAFGVCAALMTGAIVMLAAMRITPRPAARGLTRRAN